MPKFENFQTALDYFDNYVNATDTKASVDFWADYLKNQSSNFEKDKKSELDVEFDNLTNQIEFNERLTEDDKIFLENYIDFIRQIVEIKK